MKLHWPQMERQLRRRVRAEIRASPELKREYKRLRRRRTSQFSGVWLARMIYLMWCAGALQHLTSLKDYSLAATALVLWGLAFIFFRARDWALLLYDPAVLSVLYSLPVPDAAIFQLQAQRFWWRSLWTLADFLVGFACLAVLAAGPFPWFAVLLAAVLQWGVIVGMALLLCLYRPRWITFQAPLLLLCATLLYGFTVLAEPELLRPLAWQLLWLSPTGWACQIFQYIAISGPWERALIFLLPVVLVFVGGGYACQRWRSIYTLSPAAEEPLEEEENAGPSTGYENRRQPGRTEIEDFVLDRGFLQPLPWAQSGLLERWFGGWLTPREQIVAEFLLGNPPGWTRQFRWGLIVAGIGLAAGFLGAPWNIWGLVIGGGITIVLLLPVLGGTWAGLESVQNYGVVSLFFASFPIGFNEVCRVILKANTIRSAAALPFILLFSMAAAWRFDYAWTTGLSLSARFLALFWLSQPLTTTFLISQGTSDSRCWWLGMLFVGAVLLQTALAIAAVFVPYPWIAVGLCALMGACSWSCMAAYRHAYDHNWFDVQRRQDPQ